MRVTRVIPLVAALAAAALVAEAAPGHRARGGHRVFLRPSFGYFAGPWWGGFGGWWGPPGYFAYPGAAVGWEQAAAVRLQVEPRETEVYVDGYFAGVVDDFDGAFQRLRMLPGAHTLELYLGGYRPVRQDVHVGPGNTLKIRYAMEPLGEGEPDAARPAPAEESAPAPPATADARPPAAPRAPAPAAVPLRPAAERPAPPEREAAQFGQLLVRTQPRVVEVWVDGDRWPADTDGTLALHLPAGVHRIELRSAGHDPFETEIEVRAGEARELNVRLRHDGSSL